MATLVTQLKAELEKLTDAEKMELINALLPAGLHLVSDEYMEYNRQALLLQVDQVEKECIRLRGARWEPTSQIRKSYTELKRAQKRP
jgi:hypothetical protein